MSKIITFKECCSIVAQKHKLGNNLVTGHKYSYYEEAAIMYAELIRAKTLKVAADKSVEIGSLSLRKQSILDLVTHPNLEIK